MSSSLPLEECSARGVRIIAVHDVVVVHDASAVAPRPSGIMQYLLQGQLTVHHVSQGCWIFSLLLTITPVCWQGILSLLMATLPFRTRGVGAHPKLAFDVAGTLSGQCYFWLWFISWLFMVFTLPRAGGWRHCLSYCGPLGKCP